MVVEQSLPVDEKKKQAYFYGLIRQYHPAFAMHTVGGLRDLVPNVSKREQKERNEWWGNVSQHCAVELARGLVFADLLKLSEAIQDLLAFALAAHDFYKKHETTLGVEYEGGWEGFEIASQEANKIMRDRQISDPIIRMVNSIGFEGVLPAEEILAKKELSEEDVACLLMYYIDAYTQDSDWVTSASKVVENEGQWVNDLDRRIQSDNRNPRYAILNKDGRQRLGERTTYEAMLEIGVRIQQKLTELIADRTGTTVEPQFLPEFIDQEIRKRIQSQNITE